MIMPYSKNSQLPESVRNALPDHAQSIFRKAFNSSHAKYGEISAFRIAWAAVKKSYVKGADGKWVRK